MITDAMKITAANNILTLIAYQVREALQVAYDTVFGTGI